MIWVAITSAVRGDEAMSETNDTLTGLELAIRSTRRGWPRPPWRGLLTAGCIGRSGAYAAAVEIVGAWAQPTVTARAADGER
jgi:hypothetical protein